MIKKTISFSLIFLLIFLIYYFLINTVKTSHYVEYMIENENKESFEIEENYIKGNDDDYYLLKVKNNNKNYIFEVNNYFNKQKNIIKDITIEESNGYTCIEPKYVDDKYYSLPICEKNNVIYSYGNIKNQVNFSDYIEKISDPNKDKYQGDGKKIDEVGIVLNKGYFDDNEIMMIYSYKQVSIHYKDFNRVLSFSALDNYKNDYGMLVGKYYLIPNLTSSPDFSIYYKYDVVDGIKTEIELPKNISKQSYINGVYDNKLYIFDKSELKQYEIDPKKDNVSESGNTNSNAFAYINGEKKEVSVYEMNSKDIIFSENLDDYSSLDYDKIYYNSKYVIYEKNGNYYKVYKKYLDSPIFLFSDNSVKNLKAKYNSIYFVKDNSIYKYNEYGLYPMAINEEFKYNYNNIFDVYKY